MEANDLSNIPIPIESAFKTQAESTENTELLHPLYESAEVFNAKMLKAQEDIAAGRIYSSEEIRALMYAKYGV